MKSAIDRRGMLARAGAAAVAGLAATAGARAEPAVAEQKTANEPFSYCLNTGTIRGQKQSLVQEVEIAAEAGYQGIEPWTREIQEFLDAGGRLDDLRKRISDSGLRVENAISFAPWIVDDDERRAAGLETARREMELVRKLGGRRIAAPPAGATGQTVDLRRAAERYRALLEIGQRIGVTPQLEVWGSSKTMGRLSELIFVAVESGRADARLLPDVFHIYKGASSFESLRLIDGGAIEVFHLNDYPAQPPRETIRDADRVYPGDGVAPLSATVQTLRTTGFRGVLSLELFNRQYWSLDPLQAARTGLEKMRRTVRNALA